MGHAQEDVGSRTSTRPLPAIFLAQALLLIGLPFTAPAVDASAVTPEGESSRKVRLCVKSDIRSLLGTTAGASLKLSILGSAKAAHDLGYEIELIELPLLRCMKEVALGRQDGTVATSLASARQHHLSVPHNRSFGERTSYSYAYSREQNVSPVREPSWDGHRLHGLRGNVVAMPKETQGSLGSLVHGDVGVSATLIEPSETHAGLVRMLLAGRVNVIVGETQMLLGLKSIAGNASLQIMEPPLGEQVVNAAFNQEFAQANPELVNAMWSAGALIDGTETSSYDAGMTLNELLPVIVDGPVQIAHTYSASLKNN